MDNKPSKKYARYLRRVGFDGFGVLTFMVIILQKINWKLHQKIDSNGFFSPRKSRSFVSTFLLMYMLKTCIVCYSSAFYNYTTLFVGDFMSGVMEDIFRYNLS